MKKQPGTAVLSYRVNVKKAGRYTFAIHARRDHETLKRAGDQVNDVSARLNGEGRWTRMRHKTRSGQWGWMTNFSFHHGLKNAMFELSAGVHVIASAVYSDNNPAEREKRADVPL